MLYCIVFYCVVLCFVIVLRCVVLYCIVLEVYLLFTLLSLFGPCSGISALSFFIILWILSAFRSINTDLKLVQ